MIKEEQIPFSGGFLHKVENWHDYCMVLTEKWGKTHEKIRAKYDVKEIRLSDSAGWREDSIDFLADMAVPFEGVEVYSLNVKSLKILEQFDGLKHLSLEVDRKTPWPDFSCFPKLRSCFLSGWRKEAERLFECKFLERLNLSGIPFEDLEPFTNLPDLQILQLFQCRKLASFKGAEKLNKLTKVELYSCSKLSNIESLAQCRQLTDIEITCCKKLETIPSLRDCSKLKVFMIDNCGDIKSLTPLENCESLEWLCFIESTKILDGQLDFLYRMPNLKKCAFANRKHYSLTREELWETLPSQNKKKWWNIF